MERKVIKVKIFIQSIFRLIFAVASMLYFIGSDFYFYGATAKELKDVEGEENDTYTCKEIKHELDVLRKMRGKPVDIKIQKAQYALYFIIILLVFKSIWNISFKRKQQKHMHTWERNHLTPNMTNTVIHPFPEINDTSFASNMT